MIGEFQTERLRARPLTADDAQLVVELNSDPEVMRHLTGRAMTEEESTHEADSSIGTRWLLFRSDDGGFVGWVGAEPTAAVGEFDIGWRLARSAWSHGYATEAGTELVDRLFADGAQRIVATTMAVNRRSRSVMERLGLAHARTFHPEFDDPLPGTEFGEIEYAATRDEWQRPPVQ